MMRATHYKTKATQVGRYPVGGRGGGLPCERVRDALWKIWKGNILGVARSLRDALKRKCQLPF